MPITDRVKKSSYIQELERRANDTLIVYNPLDEDYIVEWDRRGGVKRFRVRSKQEAYIPRYIAVKYLKEMFTKIVNKKAADAIAKENERRVKAGMAIMDKTQRTGEQAQFESPFYNMEDDETKKILSVLYVGVDREFGIDEEAPPEPAEIDTRPTFDRALEGVQEEKDRSRVISTPKTPENATSETSVPKKEVFNCEYPGCAFTTTTKIALFGHRKSHRKETDVENLKDKEEAAKKAVPQ